MGRSSTSNEKNDDQCILQKFSVLIIWPVYLSCVFIDPFPMHTSVYVRCVPLFLSFFFCLLKCDNFLHVLVTAFFSLNSMCQKCFPVISHRSISFFLLTAQCFMVWLSHNLYTISLLLWQYLDFCFNIQYYRKCTYIFVHYSRLDTQNGILKEMECALKIFQVAAIFRSLKVDTSLYSQ